MTQHNTEKLVKELPEKIRILQKVIDDLMKDLIEIKKDTDVLATKDTDILAALSASVGMFHSTLETYIAYLETMEQEMLYANKCKLPLSNGII